MKFDEALHYALEEKRRREKDGKHVFQIKLSEDFAGNWSFTTSAYLRGKYER